MRPHVPALLLALLHLLLGLAYAAEAPWRTAGVSNGIRLGDIGAPDEVAHANYVEALMSGRGLPVLDPARAAADQTYESHQPPLFYALDAVAGRTIGLSGVESASAKMPLRGFNALVGAVGVFGVYLLALWASEDRRLALGAAAIAALLPMNAALSGAVSNDPLCIALSTFALAFGARYLRQSRGRYAAAMGVLIALAVLTKLTALVLLAVPFFIVRDRRHLATALGVAAALIAPLLVRNQVVYGHPLAANAFAAAFVGLANGQPMGTPRGIAHWLYVLLAGTAESGLGEFGYMDIQFPNALAFPLIALLLVGLVRGGKLPEVSPAFRRASLAFVGLLVLSYVGFNLKYVQPQARYVFPAIGLLALMVATGLSKLGPRGVALGVLLAGLTGADAYALATLPGEFAVRAARAVSNGPF